MLFALESQKWPETKKIKNDNLSSLSYNEKTVEFSDRRGEKIFGLSNCEFSCS